MKFPYGISDFFKIRSKDYYYGDRSEKISLLENSGDHLLFLRPRRFGKSLWLSTLENYYDLAKADDFAKLFGNLAIGQKPTSSHNQYFILKLDFSTVSPLGNTEKIEQNLHDHINGRIELFSVYYRNYLDYKIEQDKRNSLRSLDSVLAAVQQTPYKLYLLIDEYDNFANELMMSQDRGKEHYKKLLYGTGIFKTFFKTIKSLASGSGLDKVFITGVSPVVMADITSGYNIVENIYLKPEFNDLCGFKESEIKAILEQIITDCHFPMNKVDEALSLMRVYYNGYAFTYDKDPDIYNPTLALYFLKFFQSYCDYPRSILDSNLAMDKNRLHYISKLSKGNELILNLIDEEKPLTIRKLADTFGIDDMLGQDKDFAFMASLLYYLGALTIAGTTNKGKLILQIPNLVTRQLYIEKTREILVPNFNWDESLDPVESFYSDGAIEPLCNFIEEKYLKVFDNRDYIWSNELTIKTLFLTLLFNDVYYIMDSETSLDRGYADLTMIVRPDMRKYQLLDILIEFKYVSLGDLNLSGAKLKQMNRDKLITLSPVKIKIEESVSKLRLYQQTLLKNYDHKLKLKVYSIVALGFDRLLWAEIQ